MAKLKINLKSRKFKFIGLVLVLIVAISILGLTLTAPLEDDVEVMPDSDLTYYLQVSYDGVDKYGIEAGDDYTAEVRSGYIYVNDRIPDGLTFKNFITAEDGSVGAVSFKDGTA